VAEEDVLGVHAGWEENYMRLEGVDESHQTAGGDSYLFD
jgi:hypothetical protein